MSKISEFADTFYDQIRNPQISELVGKLEAECRDYGLRDIEFDVVVDMLRESLFTFTEFIDDDDDEDYHEEP